MHVTMHPPDIIWLLHHCGCGCKLEPFTFMFHKIIIQILHNSVHLLPTAIESKHESFLSSQFLNSFRAVLDEDLVGPTIRWSQHLTEVRAFADLGL